MRPKSRAVVWGLVGACAVLLVGSVLPVWMVLVDYQEESVGYPGMLWRALAWLPSNMRQSAGAVSLWELHSQNLARGILLLIVSGAVGFGVYWWLSHRLPRRTGPRTDDRERLLARLSKELRLPAEQIAATAAWRSFPDSAGSLDSLDVVELILEIEEEMGEGRRR